MTPDKLAVLAGSVGLIGFIYWYFLGKKEDGGGEAVEKAAIKVSGGYVPAVVKVLAGKTARLTFTRIDPTDCLEEIVFPDLKIKKTLPMNQPVEIEIKVDKPGEYSWHCGMSMYHGKVIAI